MDEKEILAFRNRAIPYFESVLIKEGYSAHRASELGFYIAKVLEDTFSLVEDVEKQNEDSDEVMDHIHLLYTCKFAFEEGHKILMYEDQES